MPKIKTGDVYTYYQIKGQGQPLVFIHGAWLSSQLWDQQVNFFSRNYQVVVYDIRGHGKTADNAGHHTIDLYVNDLRSLLQRLKIRRPIICGLSLGGMIAQTYARDYPADLQGLVLVSSSNPVALSFSDKLQKYTLAWVPLHVLVIRLLGVKKYSSFALGLGRMVFGKRYLNQTSRQFWTKQMIKMSSAAYIQTLKAMFNFSGMKLDSLKCPTLIIRGEYESKQFKRHMQIMSRKMRKASLVNIPYSGHLVNRENAKAFNRTLGNFLKQFENYGEK